MGLFIVPRLWRPTSSSKPEDPVVASLHKVLTSSIGPFLDPDRLQALAEDLGCVHRNRDHHAGLVADALILSALQQGADTQGRWLDAQTVYERIGGKSTGPTSFRNTLRKLKPVFRELLRRRFETLGQQTPALQGRLRDFVDVLMPDAQSSKEFAHEKNTKAPEGTTTGVTAGGVVGGALGLLAGIGALAIPGVGPFIAAGPIMGARPQGWLFPGQTSDQHSRGAKVEASAALLPESITNSPPRTNLRLCRWVNRLPK